MITIIAGSRGITNYDLVDEACAECGWTITEVFSGHANGVDALGEGWAKEHNLPLALFPARWDIHAKSAGYIRNEQMASQADALVAIWDGKSRGTKNMIDIANTMGLKVYVKVV